MSSSRRGLSPQVLLAAVLAALVSAGAMTAIAQTTSKPIRACYAKKGKQKGLVRIATKCRKGERKLSWNQVGPAGAAGTDASAPAGQVAYFDTAACPAGWTSYAAAAGRYLVATPAGGERGAAVGTALGDRENRATGIHTHVLTDPGHTHAVPYDNEMYSVPDQDTLAGTERVGGDDDRQATTIGAQTGITIAAAGTVDGTNAPYLQLIACRKG